MMSGVARVVDAEDRAALRPMDLQACGTCAWMSSGCGGVCIVRCCTPRLLSDWRFCRDLTVKPCSSSTAAGRCCSLSGHVCQHVSVQGRSCTACLNRQRSHMKPDSHDVCRTSSGNMRRSLSSSRSMFTALRLAGHGNGCFLKQCRCAPCEVLPNSVRLSALALSYREKMRRSEGACEGDMRRGVAPLFERAAQRFRGLG